MQKHLTCSDSARGTGHKYCLFLAQWKQFTTLVIEVRFCLGSSNVLCFWLCRQLILCRVTLGKSFLQFSAIKMAHAPPGHHSIIGRPSSGGLMFPEYVVYRGEQVNTIMHICNCSLTVNKQVKVLTTYMYMNLNWCTTQF